MSAAAEKIAKADHSKILFLTGPGAGTRLLAIERFLKALGAPWRQELARLFPEIGARPGPARAGIDDHLRIFQGWASC